MSTSLRHNFTLHDFDWLAKQILRYSPLLIALINCLRLVLGQMLILGQMLGLRLRLLVIDDILLVIWAGVLLDLILELLWLSCVDRWLLVRLLVR